MAKTIKNPLMITSFLFKSFWPACFFRSALCELIFILHKDVLFYHDQGLEHDIFSKQMNMWELIRFF